MSGYAAAPGTRVLAIDDDPDMLGLIEHMLKAAGYQVEVAADGDEGLQKIRSAAPELVICDVQMPGRDGFAVLEAVRADAATAALPFVLLTALTDRESVRRGMRLGADDFLSKPVRPLELVEAISAALDKRRRLSGVVSGRALPEAGELRERYAAQLEGGVAPSFEPDLAGMTGRRLTQTVLFSDIHGFTAMSERLPVADVAELLSQYLREACKPIVRERGRIMKIMGDGLMAVFGQEAPHDVAKHAAAALRAGQRIVEAAQEFRRWIAGRYDLPGLAPFEVGVGVHTGEVMLFRLAGGAGDLTAQGDTVNVASRLEAKSKELGWPVVASLETIGHAGAGFEVAETRSIELPGRPAPISIGRLAAVGSATTSLPSSQNLSAGVQAVLQANAQSTARAAKAALDLTLYAIDEQLDAAGAVQFDAEPAIHGYRVLNKIGEGGMSSVYLAEDQAHRRKVVLKVLKGRRGDDDAMWKRFFQECAIVSGIDHEHVVRIYDQGFGDELAYIAMEHLGGGSLREVIDGGLSPRQALSLLSQAASGLAEIHHRGIVHRDIKPANLMLRAAGVLVLTDFGVAKRLDAGQSHTVHGEVLGTPYYLSPEQAQSGAVTPQSDLYSLGVIYHEMLTGRRPFAGETILEIISQHVAAPIPRLPAELAGHQGLIDGLLAKRPEDRFSDAGAVLEEINQVWTSLALRRSA